MQNTLSIARREFASYFHSPVAYVVLSIYLTAATALYFHMLGGGLFVAGAASMRTFFGVAPWLFMFLGPAIAMRLIAEERRSGTLEILMTLPVTESEVVAGKFFGAVGMLGVGLACTLPVPIVLSGLVAEGFTFDWGPVVGGYLGLLLLASAFLAIGMLASSLTRNQIVSFIVGLIFCFAFTIMDTVAFVMPKDIAPFFQYLSATWHFENIARGVVDTRDVLFYLTLILIGLRASVTALKSVRK